MPLISPVFFRFWLVILRCWPDGLRFPQSMFGSSCIHERDSVLNSFIWGRIRITYIPQLCRG
ncbi:MAG: hypothetical protein ACKOCS_04160, partial [Microcystis sp.]